MCCKDDRGAHGIMFWNQRLGSEMKSGNIKTLLDVIPDVKSRLV